MKNEAERRLMDSFEDREPVLPQRMLLLREAKWAVFLATEARDEA